MQIIGIKFRKQGAKLAQGYRFSPGIGKMRSAVSIHGAESDLELFTYALEFALAGRKHVFLSEVWLDLADDAGDSWSIERGPKGSVFRKNNKLLSIEEAQRSLLASLLDLDASLSQSEGLVAPIELRKLICHDQKLASVKWDLSRTEMDTEVLSRKAALDHSQRCGELFRRTELADPMTLSKLAVPLTRLLGVMGELDRQEKKLISIQVSESLGDQNLDSVQTELDLLNQIDQAIRRVNEGGESHVRMTGQLDHFETRILEIEASWTTTTLQAIQETTDPCIFLDQLIRLRAWSRFADCLQRIKIMMDDQVQASVRSALNAWNDFIGKASQDGEDIESCLASMLLGIKQMSLEVDRYQSQLPQITVKESTNQMSWWEKLRLTPQRYSEPSLRDSNSALSYQREWMNRLGKEVEGVKAATEYALQVSQSLIDKTSEAPKYLDAESAGVRGLFLKVAAEYERLKDEWSKTASKLGVSESVTMEVFCKLIREAQEYSYLIDARQDLRFRIDERQSIQGHLASLVQKWWDLNGSQKNVDLSHLSILIVEAKGALRYRDGRKNRIQKNLDDSAVRLANKATAKWIESRRSELRNEWEDVFTNLGLSPLSWTDDNIQLLVDASYRCGALLQLADAEAKERLSSASLWPSRLDSAIVVCRWTSELDSNELKVQYLATVSQFIGDGTYPVILLVHDERLIGFLKNAGIGSSQFFEGETTALIDGPRREGAAVQSELKSRKISQESPKVESVSIAPKEVVIKKSSMSPRAVAALKVLNPKSVR